MKFEIKKDNKLVRFLTNQQIDTKKKKLKKRVFFDSRHFDKCSIAFPTIESYVELKKIANLLNSNAKFKAFAELDCMTVVEFKQDIEHSPETIDVQGSGEVEFISHGHIIYKDFKFSEGSHITPEFEMLLDKLKRSAIYLLDNEPDKDEFIFETYIVNPKDPRGRKLILSKAVGV